MLFDCVLLLLLLLFISVLILYKIYDFQQFLVLMLQIVASIALNHVYHENLVFGDIPNIVNQLLLPSNEWYYTNHTEKYGQYVKYYAARLLVYLGFAYRINTSLFDMAKGKQCERIEISFYIKLFNRSMTLRHVKNNIKSSKYFDTSVDFHQKLRFYKLSVFYIAYICQILKRTVPLELFFSFAFNPNII